MRYLLTVVQCPLFVTTGMRNWKRKTVPVGRSLTRFPSAENVFPDIVEARVFWEVVLEEEVMRPLFVMVLQLKKKLHTHSPNK